MRERPLIKRKASPGKLERVGQDSDKDEECKNKLNGQEQMETPL